MTAPFGGLAAPTDRHLPRPPTDLSFWLATPTDPPHYHISPLRKK